MKKDFIEYLDFEDEMPKKVGRPKLADRETKKKSLIIASVSFGFVILLLIFGYGTLFGFDNTNLLASLINNKKEPVYDNVLIEELKPLVKDITLKKGAKRKLYLTVLPASAKNKKISYISSDDSVASIDKNGVVTALKEGKVVITASSNDGTNKKAEFNIKIIKDSSGTCEFATLNKRDTNVNYEIKCDNAKVKEIQYKIGNGDYEKLLTKKLNDSVKFSKDQLNKNVTLKVVYYPNNSKITKYSTEIISNTTTTKKQNIGNCELSLREISSNSSKYDILCNNATVTKIAYKIGKGSYVGIDKSSLADTILYEESGVTRQLYFNIEYQIDGSREIGTVTKTGIIPNAIIENEISEIEE